MDISSKNPTIGNSPYDDPLFVTAQILSIVTLFVSWIFWGSFIVNVVAVILVQIPWCCRQSSGTLYTTFAVAVTACLSSMGVGIYVLEVFDDKLNCYPWDLSNWGHQDDLIKNDFAECKYQTWAAIAFVCAFLWMIVSVLLAFFVSSGRHARWEEKHSDAAGDDGDNVDAAAIVEQGSGPPLIGTAVAAPEDAPGKRDVTD